MSAGQARQEAEALFGDPAEIERRLRRDARRRGVRKGTTTMMGQLAQDIAFAARTFRRSPGFALVAVLTLGLALAGNTAIFSVLDAAVLRALPFPDANRLVFVNGYHLQSGERAIRLASVPEFRDWRERSRAVRPMAAVDFNTVTVAGDEGAERVPAEVVSEGYFELLGARTTIGRTFTAEEFDTPDGFPVAVIGHALWQRRFGGDAAVLGRTLSVNERTLTVIGVLDEGFEGTSLGVDLWMPLGMISVVGSTSLLDGRGNRFLGVIGRLAHEADVGGAQVELDRIAAELRTEHPEQHADRFAEVQPLREGYLGSTGGLLWTLAGAGALLLLIAAANVANLLLVRSKARARELTVRRAVGAEGTRIARQLITESLTLAALGGAVGLFLAGWALQSLTPLIPVGVLPAYAQPELSPRAFLFTLTVLGLVGIAAGMAPAVASAGHDISAALRAGGRGMTGGRARAQQLFVVTQVALAILLLAGAGLLTRSVAAQLSVDPGLEMEGIHVFAAAAAERTWCCRKTQRRSSGTTATASRRATSPTWASRSGLAARCRPTTTRTRGGPSWSRKRSPSASSQTSPTRSVVRSSWATLPIRRTRLRSWASWRTSATGISPRT
jgi:predicted permease